MTLFLVIWLFLSLIIGLLGLILLIDDKKLSPLFTVIYKYGKLLHNLNNEERSVSNSFLIRWIQVPKRHFSHFYAIAAILHLIVLLSAIFCDDQTRKNVAVPLNFLFGDTKYDGVEIYLFYFLCLTHIARRFIESVFVAVPSSAKINVVHYLTGIGFYLSVTLFNANNLFTSVSIVQECPHRYTIGLILHFTGQIVQFFAHHTLAELRRKNDKPRGKAGYYLPNGGLFEYIACPNYFAEIVIYVGLFFLSNLNRNWLALLIWVISNQTVAALLNQKWYKQTFGSRYPSHRKAILPFIL